MVSMVFIHKYSWYGYAAFSAYDAYNDPLFLMLAQEAWGRANNQTVTKENLSLWQSICDTNSSQLVGGVYFFSKNTSQTTVFLGNINGLFLVYFRLSALLAEATSNKTYLDAAISSATFIQANMFGTQGAVQAIDVKESCDDPKYLDVPITEHTGLWIEGLSVLASTTGNSSTIP
ncbi:hypothetical protein MPER_02386, partial [Moniliophthora perniciosa FA553]